MARSGKSKFVLLLVVLFSISMLSACSSLNRKFTASMAEDISAFSDQTVTIMAEADLGFGKNDAIYLRPFVDVTQPEELAFYEAEQKGLKLLRGMVLYSLDLSRIAETYETDEEKINALVDELATIKDDTRQNMNFTPESYAQLLEEIRSESTFRNALLKSQPIINLFGQYLNQVMDEFSTEVLNLANAIDERIDGRYRNVIRYQAALEKEKYAVLAGMGYLYKVYTGDKEAYAKLVDSGVIIDPDILPKGEPNKKEMLAIGDHLKDRLKGMHLISQEIQPDWDNYRATHKELDAKHTVIKERISRVRAIAVLWVRAHLKMASGKTQPAEWFDVQDVQGLVKLVL